MQWMMLTLPNSGSTWLGKIIGKHGRSISYYDKEFFSPNCNPIHRETIAEGFGSEPVAYYKKIAKSSLDKEHRDELERIYDATWSKYLWNFDKEVYSSWKVDFFAEKFSCFCVLRKPGSMFPPKRGRVNHWYDAIYLSAIENGAHSSDEKLSLLARATKGYDLARGEILNGCRRNQIPVFDIDDLMFGSQRSVNEWLRRLPIGEAIDIGSAADEILANRQYNDRTWRDII